MKQTILILLILILFAILYCLNYYQENFTDDINVPLENIKNFTKEISIYRPVESENLQIVKKKIIKSLTDIGLTVSIQTFTRMINNKVYNFSNIIATNGNSKAPYITLGCHIDAPQIPGIEATIDAATSISLMIELARNVINKNPDYPLMLLFLDGEEAIDGPWQYDNTLSGSRYFVNNFNLDKIDKLFIFDLIGGSFENKIAAFSNNPESHQDFQRLAKINTKYMNKIFLLPQEYIASNSINDDHVPFKEKDKYAMDLIPYKFPSSHHTIADNYDNVNWDYVDTFYKVFYEFLFTLNTNY